MKTKIELPSSEERERLTQAGIDRKKQELKAKELKEAQEKIIRATKEKETFEYNIKSKLENITDSIQQACSDCLNYTDVRLVNGGNLNPDWLKPLLAEITTQCPELDLQIYEKDGTYYTHGGYDADGNDRGTEGDCTDLMLHISWKEYEN